MGKMFKLQRSKPEKAGEKIDFRFLQFQATRVPVGWDKLVVSIISVETGKAVARTNKALVRSGSCQWSEAVSESVHFLQDDASKELEEKLFKFVVSMGSARSGVLGEATINLGDYVSSKFPVSISLPLKKCNHGTILSVKIQCLNPRAGSRKFERRKEGAIEQDDQNSVSDDTDNRSEGSDHILAGSVGSSSGSHLGYGFQQTKDGASSPATSRHSSDSAEFLSSGSSTANSLPRQQDSNSSRDGSVPNRTGNGQDSSKSSPSSFNGMGTGAMVNLQKQLQERSTQGSQGSIENVNRGMHPTAFMRGNDHSKGSLEAAEATIQELRKEAMMWERNARKSGAEVDTLKHQFAEQTKQYSDLKMEFYAARSEKDSLRSELEQLKSVVEDSTEREHSLGKARSEADDAKRMVNELQDQIEHLKQSNTELDIQLRKTRESNMELVSVLQELEETIEQKNVEIDKFSEEREKLDDLEALRQELERMKLQRESEVKPYFADAERDSLNKEVEQLRSALQVYMESHSIAETVNWEAENGKFNVQKLQEEVEIEKESNNSLNIQLQKTQESNKHLLSVVQELEEKLEEREREIEHLSNIESSAARDENKCGIFNGEAEWMQKLSSKDEEIRKLEAQIYNFQIQKSSINVTDYSDQSQEDLGKALEISRKEMDELERDCKELTDENMELIFKLNKLNKILESKNISIPEVEDYQSVQNNSTIRLKDAADKATTVQCELDYSLKKIADLEGDNKRMKDALLKEAGERQNAENLISNLHQINEELEAKIEKMEAKQLQAFSQVSEHDEHVSQLQNQLNNYAYREKHLEGTIQQLEHVNLELQSEIQKLKEHHTNKSGIEELEIQLSVLSQETHTLRSSKHELEMQMSNLQMEKVNLEHKLEITQEESKAARVHLDELGRELARLTVSMESQMSAKRIIEKKAIELESNKEELESHLTDLEVENVQLSERISGLEAQLRYITEERESYRLEVENAKSHCTDLQSDLHRLELELRGENVELQKSLRESEEKFSGALEETESYKRENQLLQLKLHNLMKEYAESNAKHEEQTFEMTVSRANIEEQLEELTEHFSSSTKQVKSLESELATLKKEMIEKERVLSVEIEALLVSIKEQEQKVVRAEAAVSQVQLEKASTVECLQNEVQRLTEQMSSTYDEKESMATKALIEASELRAEKVKLEDALKQIQVKVRHCEMELASVRQDYESKVQLLIHQLNASKIKEEEMNVRLEDMKLGEASSGERIQDLEKMIKHAETENQKVKDEHDALMSQAREAVNLKAEMGILRSTIEDVGREKSRLESSLHFIDVELGRVKAEKASLIEKLETMKAAVSEQEEIKRSKVALEEKLLRLQSELNTKEASIAYESGQKNESIRLKRQNSQFQRKLQDLQEEREESQSKVKLLEEELQLKADALSKAEQKYLGMSMSKVEHTSPSRDSKEVAELHEKLRFIEGELETVTKEFEVKERDLHAQIEYLENVNRQLTQAQKEFSTNKLQGEVTWLQKQNPSLSDREHELLSKLGSQDSLQKEIEKLQEVNKELHAQLSSYRETEKSGDILDRVFALETELAEALESNTMYKSQLRSFLCQDQNVHVAALQNFGTVDQVVNDLLRYKQTVSSLQAELKDMQERYFQMSLQFAEVEAQREELVMTVRNFKNGKRWFR